MTFEIVKYSPDMIKKQVDLLWEITDHWKYPFGTTDEQTPLTHTTLEPDNAEVNGIQVDQDTDLLYVSVGSPNSFVCVFTLPDLEFVKNFGSNGNSYHTEPNLTLLNLLNGNKNLYVSANNIVYIHNVSDASSQNFGDLLSSFIPIQGLETMITKPTNPVARPMKMENTSALSSDPAGRNMDVLASMVPRCSVPD